MQRKQFTKISAHTLALAGLFQTSLRNNQLSAEFGALKKDPKGLVDLPKGFDYTVFSKTGEIMNDGLPVPDRHDGMAAFPGPNGTIKLIRNHENNPHKNAPKNLPLLRKVPKNKIYDSGYDKYPSMGGTTTLTYDPKKRQLVEHHMSLAGTVRNCAGGPTLWNSWITCEESVLTKSKKQEKDHGYCFDIPVDAQGLVDPQPIKAMGRFNHEAIAIDPRTGYVYLTEDRPDGLFYRYLPKNRTKLAEGGQLQALCYSDHPKLNTSNHHKKTVHFKQSFKAKWINLDNVTAPDDDLRFRGQKAGAATFSGGEGIWYHEGQIIFTCKSGGRKGLGQTFIYRPDASPTSTTSTDGKIELFLEPNDKDVYNSGDNLTVHPNGDIYICEDGKDINGVIRISPDGKISRFLTNTLNSSELCGGSFSPDGKIFFVNIQKPGLTLAIHGPFV